MGCEGRGQFKSPFLPYLSAWRLFSMAHSAALRQAQISVKVLCACAK